MISDELQGRTPVPVQTPVHLHSRGGRRLRPPPRTRPRTPSGTHSLCFAAGWGSSNMPLKSAFENISEIPISGRMDSSFMLLSILNLGISTIVFCSSSFFFIYLIKSVENPFSSLLIPLILSGRKITMLMSSPMYWSWRTLQAYDFEWPDLHESFFIRIICAITLFPEASWKELSFVRLVSNGLSHLPLKYIAFVRTMMVLSESWPSGISSLILSRVSLEVQSFIAFLHFSASEAKFMHSVSLP